MSYYVIGDTHTKIRKKQQKPCFVASFTVALATHLIQNVKLLM